MNTQPTTRRDINMAELRRLIPRLARLIESEEVMDAVAAKILDKLSEIDISDLSDPQRTACGASPPGTEPGPQDAGSTGRIPRVSAGAGDLGIVMLPGQVASLGVVMLPGQVVYFDDLAFVDFIRVIDLEGMINRDGDDDDGYDEDLDSSDDGEPPCANVGNPEEFATQGDEDLDTAIEWFLRANRELDPQTLLMNERLFSEGAIALGSIDPVFEYVELAGTGFYYVRP